MSSNNNANRIRKFTIGMAEDVLFVVYTERKEIIRLISARIATSEERSIYYDNILITIVVSNATFEKAEKTFDADYSVALGRLLDKAVKEYVG